MMMVMTALLMVKNLMKTQTNDFLITRPFTLHCRRTLKGLIAPGFFKSSLIKHLSPRPIDVHLNICKTISYNQWNRHILKNSDTAINSKPLDLLKAYKHDGKFYDNIVFYFCYTCYFFLVKMHDIQGLRVSLMETILALSLTTTLSIQVGRRWS